MLSVQPTNGSRLVAVGRWTVLSSLLLLTVGCGSEPPPTPRRTIDRSPQAKFDRVVAALRDGLDTGAESGGGRYTFSDGSGAGSTVFSYHVDAPEKIVEPKQPGALPRATIRITQSSSYSSLSTNDDEEEEEEDESKSKRKQKDDKNNSNRNLPDDAESELGDMGFEVLDPSLVDQDLANATEPRIKAPDISTRTFTTATEVVYELVFENQRWRMAQPPAADAPESANIALQMALKRQQ